MPTTYHVNLRFPRFYPILDTSVLAARSLGLVDAVQALLAAGVEILQIRHKSPFTRAVFAQVREAARLVRQSGTALIINDRADVALILDAGLHVGQDDLPPRDARAVIGTARMLGFSTHNPEQVRASKDEPADYIAFGPVFPTASKRNPDPCVGLDQLRAIRTLVDRPLVAIGGITRARATAVLDAGADSLAVISDLFPEQPGLEALRLRAAEWIAATA
jgi:thiamine-phosphate pyrophosphorylase